MSIYDSPFTEIYDSPQVHTAAAGGLDRWFAVAAAVGHRVERLPDWDGADADLDGADWVGPAANGREGVWRTATVEGQWIAPHLVEWVAGDTPDTGVYTAPCHGGGDFVSGGQAPVWTDLAVLGDQDRDELIEALVDTYGAASVRVDSNGDPVVGLGDGGRVACYPDGTDWAVVRYLPGGWGLAREYVREEPQSRIPGVLAWIAALPVAAAAVVADIGDGGDPLLTWLRSAREAGVDACGGPLRVFEADNVYVYSPYGQVWLRLVVTAGRVWAVPLRPDRDNREAAPPEWEEFAAARNRAAARRSPLWREVNDVVQGVVGDAGVTRYLPRRWHVQFSAPDEESRDRILALLTERGRTVTGDWADNGLWHGTVK